MKAKVLFERQGQIVRRSSLFRLRRRHVVMKCDCEDDCGDWTGTSDDP